MTAQPAPAALGREGRPPLLRLLAMARPLRGRLLLAVAAGAAAVKRRLSGSGKRAKK